MLTDLLTPAVYVTLASALFTVGYLIINQVYLRLVMMAGSFCYIAYYATAADTPLWGAIYGSILMILTNIIGLCALYLRNANISVPGRHADIYPLFSPVRPGDFRALMRLGTRETLSEETILSREGEPIDKLYFIVAGKAQIIKRGTAFPMNGPVFTGEVAYLLGGPSVATTIVPAGAQIIWWDTTILRNAETKRPRIKLALDAVISRDLATKVSFAVAPPDRAFIPMEKGPVHAPALVHQKP